LILSIETSTRNFSVSIFTPEKEPSELASLEISWKAPHSQNVAACVDFLLRNLGLQPEDIREVYAGIGPGSFTGIRVGLTFVNTLMQFLGVPLLGVSSLDVLAFDEGRWYNSVVALIRSRKDEYFSAFYKKAQRVSDYLVLKKEEFVLFCKNNNPACVVASEESREAFSALNSAGLKAEKYVSFPRARNVFLLARKAGFKPELRYLKPLYIRGFK